MSCPTTNTLTEFELGRLPDKRSLEVHGHIDTCAMCQATLARTGREQLMKIMGRQRAKTPLPVPPVGQLYEDPLPLFEVKPGDVVAERYRVERVIGDGGMGFVVAARHVALDQLVAMKLLRPELLLEPGAVPRFVREARAASRLKSRHVARVFDLGTTASGVPYLVMELLEGTDLGGHLAQHGAMPEVEAAHYISQACEALAEAHAADIVHRDLKPENMFLARDRDGGISLKILDFGVSKVGGARPPSEMVSTASKSLFGSPLYMSPEHLLSAKKVDARSDVWALGVILYYLVSLRFPFDGDSIASLAASVLRDPPAPLIAPVSDQFHAIVMRCLSRSPDARYPTAAELGSALAELPWQGASNDGGPTVTVIDHSTGAVDAPMSPVDSGRLARTRPMGSGPPAPPPPPPFAAIRPVTVTVLPSSRTEPPEPPPAPP